MEGEGVDVPADVSVRKGRRAARPHAAPAWECTAEEPLVAPPVAADCGRSVETIRRSQLARRMRIRLPPQPFALVRGRCACTS